MDAVWVNKEVFFWPFFGFEIPPGEAPYWPLAWERALSDPWRWAKEVVGLAYLGWLWIALGLKIAERRSLVVRSGRLSEYVTDEN